MKIVRGERFWFPSLSWKTFIRTRQHLVGAGPLLTFPSLSGKTFIRTRARRYGDVSGHLDVSIPFREDLHSDSSHQLLVRSCASQRFHPFQGRPPFGRFNADIWDYYDHVSIPFRDDLHSDMLSISLQTRVWFFTFPSLSGKSSIRTSRKKHCGRDEKAKVSIPFREDLHSDHMEKQHITHSDQFVSIPFREDLYSD